MNKDFEDVKRQLAKHLLRVDLDKLSMQDLSTYAEMVSKLNAIFEEKPDYLSKAYALMNSGIYGGYKAPSVTLKEV